MDGRTTANLETQIVCAIGIYDQNLIDGVLGLDGDKEFVLYLGAVGKKRN
jgi:hypothetical protein